jgi:predicted acetyltransferase
MANHRATSLDVATRSDSTLLANLLELYIHDLSAAFPNVELGPDGRYGYQQLPLYWSEPRRRFAFLIRRDGRVAGFVLARRGSPASEDPAVFDVAEFFVLGRYRRAGVGREAAFLLWNRLPGTWTVRVAESNPDALAFWRGVVAEFTHGTATESVRPGKTMGWRVLSFSNMPTRAP